MGAPSQWWHGWRPGPQVRLKEYGGELVEVADNGHGVSPGNYQALTLKYHTSKITDFGDLQAGGQAGSAAPGRLPVSQRVASGRVQSTTPGDGLTMISL